MFDKLATDWGKLPLPERLLFSFLLGTPLTLIIMHETSPNVTARIFLSLRVPYFFVVLGTFLWNVVAAIRSIRRRTDDHAVVKFRE